jgi:predicted  nucleic acid-binding Zn-ribbon protein
LDKFKNQERYSDLDKTIKLYQRDNAILRKKIFKLEDIETALRLKMTDVSHDKNNKKE